jgi:transketolase
MVVEVPCDNYEAEAATHAMIEYDGPFYYRCGYKGEKDIHSGKIDFKIGKANTVREGSVLTIMFCGPIGSEVVKAADMLEKDGIKCRLVSMHTIKPIDKDAIIDAVKNTGGILTVEEHNIIGGLGSAVAEVLADEGLTPKAFKRLAFPDVNIAKIGGQNWIRDQYGLQANGIADSVKKILK